MQTLTTLIFLELYPLQLAGDPDEDQDGLPGPEALGGGASPGGAALLRVQTGDHSSVTLYSVNLYINSWPIRALYTNC